MKVLFDTSALIAAFVSAHEQHERALPYLERALAGEIDMVVSAHTLAELYATLTVLPITPGITSGQAQDLIRDNVLSSAEVVGLDASDYVAVIERMARLGLVSGAIYDALHVRAAERAEADQLVVMGGISGGCLLRRRRSLSCCSCLVGASGAATISVEPMRALAIHVGAKL